MNRRLELLMTEPDGSARSIQIDLSDAKPHFVIGRAPDADLSLKDLPLQPHHCRLSLAGAAVELASLVAEAGLSCNGQPVRTTTRLNDGDAIGLGDLTLRVALRDATLKSPAPDMDQPDTPNPARPQRPQQAQPQQPPAPRQAPPAPVKIKAAPPKIVPKAGGDGGGAGIAPVRSGDSPGIPAADPFVERAMTELLRDHPERAGKRTRRELQALIERGRQRAKSYGFAQEEHQLKFLHCVMLLDNELARATNSDVQYVMDTLTVPNKPPEQRIERALHVAKRVAQGRAPTPSPAPSPGFASPAGPRKPVPPAAPPKAPAVTTVVDAEAASTHPTPPPPVEELKTKAVSGYPDIEGFRIIDQIASGGMGTVYRAHDLQLDIEVAIKVLRSLHPAAQQQFLMEARAAAKLQHPNIVPVLRYERYGQGGYCVMQLIRGRDAHRLVKIFADQVAHTSDAEQIFQLAGIEPVAVNPELRAVAKASKPYYRIIAYWIAGVADGLDRAHTEGIIHFDVKPSNLMLAADGRMLLGDFGLATLGGDKQLTANTNCIGTPAYLSPEMLAGWASRAGSSVTDLRVDIWGLGLSLYELLTYRPAYEGPLAKVLKQIATVDPAAPRDVVWQVPPELERVCQRSMARNPDDRYTRAGEMADDLRSWLAGRSLPVADRSGSRSAWSWLRGKRP
ncbi:MAG TPA: FHA domain-containing serine/threonine-protein kinase [Tepidisphaeraceae bacterium]|jgi:serine/threonine protein kinase